MHKDTHTYIYIHTHIHAYTCTHTHTYKRRYRCTHTHTHTHIHTPFSLFTTSMYVISYDIYASVTSTDMLFNNTFINRIIMILECITIAPNRSIHCHIRLNDQNYFFNWYSRNDLILALGLLLLYTISPHTQINHHDDASLTTLLFNKIQHTHNIRSSDIVRTVQVLRGVYVLLPCLLRS